jgi:hypothetical protein
LRDAFETRHQLANIVNLSIFIVGLLLVTKTSFMIFCSNCGKPIPDENKFCSNCGAPRPVAETPKQDPVEAKQPVASSPVSAAPTAAQAVVQNTAPKSSVNPNLFLTNAGFWGAVLLLIGFFLPFYKAYIDTNLSDISLATMAGGGDNTAGRILLYLLPVSAIILIIQAFIYPFPPIIANIAKILPLLLMVFALGAIMREDETGKSVGTFFEIAQIGVYLTLLGALLMLFFRRRK